MQGAWEPNYNQQVLWMGDLYLTSILLDSITIPDNLKGIFTDPHLDHSNTIIQYVSDTYGNANTIMATVEASNFDPNKVQWA
jgi:hypothetical protein